MTASSVLTDLAEVGFTVGSLSELRDSGVRYAKAIPVLISALLEAETPRDIELLARTLGTSWAGEAAFKALLWRYESLEGNGSSFDSARWAIGNSLEIMWDDRHFDQLARIAAESSNGRSRQMIVLGFGKSKQPDAVPLLLNLVHDPDVDGHAVLALVRHKDPRSREALQSKIRDSRAWVRKAALRGLQHITQSPN
ncbi:MAG: hypothetical protein JWN70_3307 [Planctomycetaceae bacterium]|nr:hypothetical protein [Planctomycetaceae bacterium]